MKKDKESEKLKDLLELLRNKEYIRTSNLENRIKINYNDLRKLIRSAKKKYFSADFIKSAKVFRQIASEIQNFNFKIEKKGSYAENNTLNDLTGKEWLRHTKSWVLFDGKPSDMPYEIKDHPASFPPALIEYFIEFFTKKEQWVFDPFMGIGSTLAACQNLGRNCFGTEINLKYCQYAIKRVKAKSISLDAYLNSNKADSNKESKLTLKVFNRDCREILSIIKENKFPPVDFCITSPPYWNILETSRGGVKSTHKKRIEEGLDEKYSDDLRDLGNITNYYQYLDTLIEIFNEIKKILKPKAYLMIIIQNIRTKDGVMVPIAWDLGKSLSKNYDLRQEFIWYQDQKFMGIWGYPKTYVSNVHHHYCLVFQAPKKEN